MTHLTREQIADTILDYRPKKGIDDGQELRIELISLIKERDQVVWDAAMTKLADMILDDADSEVDYKTAEALIKLRDKKYAESNLYVPFKINGE